MTVLPSTLAALSTPSFAAAKYVLTMSFGRKPIFNGFPAADEPPDEAAADAAVVAAADAAVVAAADAAADGAADPPELEHAANTTAATLVRAIPRPRVLDLQGCSSSTYDNARSPRGTESAGGGRPPRTRSTADLAW